MFCTKMYEFFSKNLSVHIVDSDRYMSKLRKRIRIVSNRTFLLRMFLPWVSFSVFSFFVCFLSPSWNKSKKTLWRKFDDPYLLVQIDSFEPRLEVAFAVDSCVRTNYLDFSLEDWKQKSRDENFVFLTIICTFHRRDYLEEVGVNYPSYMNGEFFHKSRSDDREKVWLFSITWRLTHPKVQVL